MNGGERNSSTMFVSAQFRCANERIVEAPTFEVLHTGFDRGALRANWISVLVRPQVAFGAHPHNDRDDANNRE